MRGETHASARPRARRAVVNLWVSLLARGWDVIPAFPAFPSLRTVACMFSHALEKF